MNPVLENKLNDIKNSEQDTCWYLVKQDTDFVKQCLETSILERYHSDGNTENFEQYFKKVANLLNANGYSISSNHRCLMVGRFYGLVSEGYTYAQSNVTDTYNEVKKRCNGQFENTSLYLDIIERQIEKMYISTSLDDEYTKKRGNFRLFPALLLYKLLLEMGQNTGKYEISTLEYNIFVITTTKYEDFLDTLFLIKLFRESDKATKKEFETLASKFDSRVILALRQLPAIEMIDDTIRLKKNYISEIYYKVTDFEMNYLPEFDENKYFNFLCSTNSFENQKKKLSSESISNKDGRVPGGQNIILYGVPGSGKSHTIQAEYCIFEDNVERVVFHPDYTYADFIGQLSPTINDKGNVSYDFVPGPFTKILKRAIDNPKSPFYLIIEELNRGNAPSIFGDIFQLLDRLENGESKYNITNSDISKKIYDDEHKKIKIPSNLSILATMNTSDQNVFTLDNAFQRRWNMRLIRNTFDGHKYKGDSILDTSVTWEKFCSVINKEILKNNSLLTASEDKRMGVYFVTKADLFFDTGTGIVAKHHNCLFAEKVIKYLWDDAFKFSRNTIFNIAESDSLEEILDLFINKKGNDRFCIFKENIISELIPSE